MKTIAIIAALALALVACSKESETTAPLNKPDPKPKQHFPVAAEALADQVEAAARAAVPDETIGTLRVDIDGNRIRVSNTRPLDGPALTREDNAATVQALAQAAISVLLEHGHDPSKEWTLVTGWDWQPTGETSPTGKPLERAFVRAVYDFNADRIKIEPVE
jgi:hypothetical protein